MASAGGSKKIGAETQHTGSREGMVGRWGKEEAAHSSNHVRVSGLSLRGVESCGDVLKTVT